MGAGVYVDPAIIEFIVWVAVLIFGFIVVAWYALIGVLTAITEGSYLVSAWMKDWIVGRG